MGLISVLGDPQKKATNISIIAWRNPWIEKPGGHSPMKLQTVGHDGAQLPTHALSSAYSITTYTGKEPEKNGYMACMNHLLIHLK